MIEQTPTPIPEAAPVGAVALSAPADKAELPIFRTQPVASSDPFLGFPADDPGRPSTRLDGNGWGDRAVADENKTNDDENTNNIKIVPPPV